MRVLFVLTLALAAGCPGQATPPESNGPQSTEAASDPEARTDAAEEDPDPAPAGTKTSAELYAECETRMEQPQADGECASDDDCATAGCGAEVCTTKAAAAEVMTTCEVLPCFGVKDTCGCHEGRCTWTLQDAPTIRMKPVTMPPQ